jgi:hypothetical protein
MPEGAVSVTRPGKWGNPFVIGGWYAIGIGNFLYLHAAEGYQDERYTKIETAEQAVSFYREYMNRSPKKREATSILRGKDLACWCAVGQPCHADVLLELANKLEVKSE